MLVKLQALGPPSRDSDFTSQGGAQECAFWTSTWSDSDTGSPQGHDLRNIGRNHEIYPTQSQVWEYADPNSNVVISYISGKNKKFNHLII